jgi:hypothetical protein
MNANRSSNRSPSGAAAGPVTDLHEATGYGLAALTGELDRLLATPEGGRNDALNRAAFALGQLIAVRVAARSRKQIQQRPRLPDSST